MSFMAVLSVPPQAASLAGFPLYIRLDDLPTEFWSSMAQVDGGDIRVKDSSFNDLPIDLVVFNRNAKTGTLFTKVDLSNAATTILYIVCGDPADTAVSPDAVNGRNTVWSAFHRVFTIGDSFVDRSGKGPDLAQVGTAYGLVSATTSPNLGVHQGIVWDGTHYYAIGTNAIKKYDASFTLVTQNSNPVASVPGTNHLGDSEVVGDYLYVPIEQYTDPDGHANMYVARFLRSDLSFVDAEPVSYASGVATGVDMTGCAYNATDGYLYFGAWSGDGTKLWKYDLTAKEFIGTLALSSPILKMQGLTFWRNAIFINRDDTDRTVRVELDGSVKGMVWGTTGGSYEGISHTDDALLVLHDPTTNAGVVRTLMARQPKLSASELGAFLNDGGYYRADGVARYTAWTIGSSASTNVTGASRSIVNYTVAGSNSGAGGSVNRSTLGYRSTDRWGVWNSTDAWINNTTAPGVQTPARLHEIHDGTGRSLYVNGVLAANAATAAVRPASGAAHALYIGGNDEQGTELWNGNIGYVYLYPGVLSADWLNAESRNLSSPATFYAITTAEVASAHLMQAASILEARDSIRGWAAIEAPPSLLTALGQVWEHGAAALLQPVSAIAAHGISGANLARISAAPGRLAARTGARAKLGAPSPLLEAAGTTRGVARAELVSPVSVIKSMALTGSVASAALRQPASTLSALTGAKAKLTQSLVSISASGSAWGAAKATIKQPAGQIRSVASIWQIATAHLIQPASVLVRPTYSHLVQPMSRVSAWGVAVPDVSLVRVAWVFTPSFTKSGEQTGMLTRWTTGPAVQPLLQVHGRVWAAAPEGLFKLDGSLDSDGETPIEWGFKTAYTDFASTHRKIASAVYVGGVLPLNARYSVAAGDYPEFEHTHEEFEVHLRNRRQLFGRGRRARYYGFGFYGAGTMRVDSLEFDIHETQRRV